MVSYVFVWQFGYTQSMHMSVLLYLSLTCRFGIWVIIVIVIRFWEIRVPKTKLTRNEGTR